MHDIERHVVAVRQSRIWNVVVTADDLPENYDLTDIEVRAAELLAERLEEQYDDADQYDIEAVEGDTFADDEED